MGRSRPLSGFGCDTNGGPRGLIGIRTVRQTTARQTMAPQGSSDAEQFTAFVMNAQPRLLRALVARFGPDDAQDAMAVGFSYAWEHWTRVSAMENPAGYVYRVATTRGRRRQRRPISLSMVPDSGIPEVEPALPSAMRRLSPRQRTAVFLVHGCQWSLEEVADLMGVSVSSVRNHLARGMRHLKRLIGTSETEDERNVRP